MIAAVGMVRDEADIIRATVNHLLCEGVDRVVLLDNGSTDGTGRIAADVDPRRVEVRPDPERGYYQSDKITALAREMHGRGATWVLPFDADEWWYSPDGRTVADVLRSTDAEVVAATEFKHWPTPWDPPVAGPYERLRWREATPHHLPKVCFRAHPTVTVHMGNHHVNFGAYNPDRPDPAVRLLELRHLPYRSWEQFARKVRQGREAYEAATRMHPMFGTHWREMGAMCDADLRSLWADAVAGEAFGHRWMGHGELVEDPCP